MKKVYFFPLVCVILMLIFTISNSDNGYSQCQLSCVSGDCANGEGIAELSGSDCENAGTMKGTFEDGSFVHGRLTMDIDGSYFDGIWENGEFISGDVQIRDKACLMLKPFKLGNSYATYKGTYKNKIMDGWGEFKAIDGDFVGSKYKGQFRNGFLNGFGTFELHFTDEAKFMEDDEAAAAEANADCVLGVKKYNHHGDQYVGEWVNCRFEGYGILYSAGRETECGIWFGIDSLMPLQETKVVEYLNRRYSLNLVAKETPEQAEQRRNDKIAKMQQVLLDSLNTVKISDNIKTEVSAQVLPQPDASGNLKNNLVITYKYDVIKAAIAGQTEDFPAGDYLLSLSNAATTLMQEFKKACETNDSLNSYLIPGIRITFNITGSTDGSPVNKSYKEEYGAYSAYECFINNEFGNISVNGKTGITSNNQLALLRCAGVRAFIEKWVEPLKNTNNSYNYYVVTNTEKGDQYRRIAVEMIIHDPFQKAKIKEITRVSDVDRDLPVTSNLPNNSVAVVIGNSDYRNNTTSRDFGVNDAYAIKKYLVEVSGYKEGNINLKTDIDLGGMRTIFGTEESAEGWLMENSNENTDVFIYFSGHGAPGKNKRCYLLPVDCNPDYAQNSAYSLDLLYANLSKIKARSIFVVLDACFSGRILSGVSSAKFPVREPENSLPNGVVISASSDYALDFPEKQHTMLTYFFLKAIQDKDNSDISPKDGKLSFQEIYDYINNENTGVPYESRRISKQQYTQHPVLSGLRDKSNIFLVY